MNKALPKLYIPTPEVWSPAGEDNERLLAVLAWPTTSQVNDLEHYQRLIEQRILWMIQAHRGSQGWRELVWNKCARVQSTEISLSGMIDAEPDLIAQALAESQRMIRLIQEVISFPIQLTAHPEIQESICQIITETSLEVWLNQLTM